jgi:transcriptional regulator with XRE-family HTH domain
MIDPIIYNYSLENLISYKLSKTDLLTIRKSQHLTQKEVSDLSGLSTQCISDIENDNGGNPTLKSIIKYLECLGYELAFQKKRV